MEEINLKELFNYFMSKISILVIIVLLVIILGNVYSLFIKTPLFQSTTKLVLVSESNAQTGITQGDVQLNSNLVATYTEIVKSRDIVNKVITNLALEDETVESLTKKISVSTTTNTQTISIRISDPDAEKAKVISDELAKVFSDEISSIYKLDNVHIYETATVAEKAYNMNFKKEFIIYTAAGLVIGCGIIFLMFILDTSVKTGEDIEDKLGLTLLGIVPKVGGK
jgi:capsular polysaccharide biosynthesis protein